MKKPKKTFFQLLWIALFIIILGFTRLVGLLTDYLWFNSVNFGNVFMVRLLNKILLFLPLWIIFALFLSIYIKSIYKSYAKQPVLKGVYYREFPVKRIINGASLLVGGIIAYGVVESLWMSYLKFMNATSFGQLDPIFHLDISFYVFGMPLLRDLIMLLITFLGFVIAATVLLELLFVNQSPVAVSEINLETLINRFDKEFFRSLLKKISYLMAICFVLLGGLFYLNTFQLLYSSRGVVFGASYTDIVITLWAYRVYALLATLSAVLTIIAFNKKKIRYFTIGPSILLVAWFLFSVTGGVVQQLIVEPDEISKEQDYLVYNIEYTQTAFGLDKVKLVEYPYEENLTLATIENNSETIKNIRINDARPLKQTFNQIQGIRLYYDFNDIDTDRYTINGEYTQVFISPRELDQYKLDNKAMTWLNQHLKYTHGYGIVMSPVNRVTEEGQPELLFKNIPPVSSTNLSITRPEIYFGEELENYIIVNTDEKEFDYPSGSDNVESIYAADTGITLNGLKKVLFAIREGSFKLFVSNNINADSQIIINRNIMNRVREIAPFLQYDANPYIVLNEEDGKLYWIIDAYTDTSYYPYSQTFDFKETSINYIRNAVKVVIDAYDGSTHFYIYDEADPIIQTYAKIFPELFMSKSEFPSGLVAHTRYPQDFFDMQAKVYRSYHVDNPVVFYNGEDVWDIAEEKYMDAIQTIESNYVMFKIDEKAEFALILPYTPKGKPNMTSLLVARNDGDHYGEMFVYRYPKNKTVQGPIMIESRIDQDSIISPQFTLWGQQGSNVLRGNVIIVPLESSLLYVEPIYIQADNENSLPEMKRVIIAYSDQIVMAQTLQEGLDQLFGEKKPMEQIQNSVNELLNQINDKFIITKESLDELEILINQLREQIK